MKWSNSNNYSANDLIAMQKDAMERVREMQRRSDERLRQSNAADFEPLRLSLLKEIRAGLGRLLDLF